MRKSPLDGWIGRKLNIDMEDRKGLEEYQLRQINHVLRTAVKFGAFYREHLGEGAALGIGSLEDFRKIPLMDSRMLRERSAGMVCVPSGEIARIVTLDTSGTTGNPKRVFFTEPDQELTIDFFHYGMSTLTYPGERVLIGLPCASPGCVGDLLRVGLLRYGAVPVPYGLMEESEQALPVLLEYRPDVLVGAPGQVLALARCCAEKQIHAGIKRILVSTEYAAPEVIRKIEELLGCEVFNHYGMTEMGLGGAVECEAHEGMHIRENDLYVEAIDPKTKEALPEGQEGELVFTTLTRTGMPLIRYRTGDMGRITSKPCACESILKRVLYVKRI